MIRTILATASLSILLLTGCAAASPTPEPDAEPADGTVVPTDSDSTGDQAPTSDVLAHIASCETVAAVVAPYIQGLVLTEGSAVDEWGVTCSWEMAEGDTNWENNRSISVAISGDPLEKPDVAELAAISKDISAVDDAWLAAEGGVAFTASMANAVSGAIATTVWLPHAEVKIGGGTWGGFPALDGPAAIEVARKLVG